MLFCQSSMTDDSDGSDEISVISENENSDKIDLPNGYREIKLGMSVDDVKTKLFKYFAYRGEPDVSFLPNTSDYLIECEGYSYIKRAYFQFYNEKLYIIILVLDETKLDHYSLLTTFTKKYGEFTSLSPVKVEWLSDDVLLCIERPMSVKYIDLEVFNKLKQEVKLKII